MIVAAGRSSRDRDPSALNCGHGRAPRSNAKHAAVASSTGAEQAPSASTSRRCRPASLTHPSCTFRARGTRSAIIIGVAASLIATHRRARRSAAVERIEGGVSTRDLRGRLVDLRAGSRRSWRPCVDAGPRTPRARHRAGGTGDRRSDRTLSRRARDREGRPRLVVRTRCRVRRRSARGGRRQGRRRRDVRGTISAHRRRADSRSPRGSPSQARR